MAKRKRIKNRDRAEYRRASRKDRVGMPKGGSHGDKRKEQSRRAARDRRLWD